MMLRPVILSICWLAFTSAQAQTHGEHDGHDHGKPAVTQPPADDPIVVLEMKHDFGKIAQGKPVYHNFVIKNVGKKPLKLENVQAACGCTTPEWSREEIPAGSTAIIKVGYNAASEGVFDKPVTLFYGGVTKQISIAGTVWRAPEGSAPRNTSIDLLKKQSN
jgi:hypothetical protein